MQLKDYVTLAHQLTFPELLAATKPVCDMRGYLLAGPDRRGANAVNPVKLWKTWQEDVQAASRRLDAVPQHVMDYFQATKGFSSPPREGEVIEIKHPGGSLGPEVLAPIRAKELQVDDLKFGEGQPSLIKGEDMNDLNAMLGMGGETTPPPAPTKLANPPRFATSYTGMTEFMLCARKWAASKFYKTVKYVETEAMADGNRGHKTAENYLLNAINAGTLPVDAKYLPRVQRYCDFFIKSGAKLLVEQEMCCTKDRKPCGWWDNNTVWFRGKGDLLAIKDRKLTYADWKFGRVKDDPFQVEVMVALADLHFGDEFDTADGKLIFVKEADPAKALCGLPKPISKADIPLIWEKILTITDRMEAACREQVFPMKQNFTCKGYCDDFSCPHNGRR